MTKKKPVKERKIEDLEEFNIGWKDLYLSGELDVKDVLFLKQMYATRMLLKEIGNLLAYSSRY